MAADQPPVADDDAAIAEFHRASRRRKAIVFGVAGIVGIAVGIVVLLISFMAKAPSDARRYQLRALGAGIVFVLTGLWSAFTSYRIATGKIDDADY